MSDEKTYFPKLVTWNITDKCNLKCSYCCGTFSEKEINFDEKLKIVDILKNYGLLDIGISGGEPFILKEIIRLLKYMKKYEMKVSINSNGTLLEEALVRELKKINLSDFEIDISLDGHNSITNDLFRGEGTFKKITENIKYLDKYGINFNIAWTVNKKNMNYISEMVGLSQKIGAKALLISDLLPIGRAKNMSDILLSRNNIKKIIQQAYALSKEYYPSLSIRVGYPFAFLVDPRNMVNEIRKERKQWRFKQHCGIMEFRRDRRTKTYSKKSQRKMLYL